MKYITLLILACAILTGCGGGADTAPAETVAAEKSTTLVAIVFGDSTFTPYYEGEEDSPSYAAKALGQRVDNQAVQGSKAYEVDVSKICASPAKVVVDNHAINDSTTEPIEQYREALTLIVETARACGKRTVLMEANVIIPEGRVNEYRTEAGVAAYDAIKSEVAAATGAIYCRRPAIAWTRAEVPDGIHPGKLAKPAIGAALAACIKGATQ